MKCIITGPPGAGKTTHALELHRTYGWEVIKTGHLLRQRADMQINGTAVGEIIAQGQLAPSDLVNILVQQELERINYSQFVIDGYPRTMAEYDALQDMISLDLVLYLEIDKRHIPDKLADRYVCEQCGFAYHETLYPPAADNTCRKCGGTVRHRQDEDQASISQRIALYNKYTQPVIKAFADDGILYQVNAQRPFTEVAADIKAIVNRVQNGDTNG